MADTSQTYNRIEEIEIVDREKRIVKINAVTDTGEEIEVSFVSKSGLPDVKDNREFTK